MISRPFRFQDISHIDTIFQKTQLSVPSLRNLICNRVFEDRGQVLAYGCLKHFSELHLNLDPSLSSFQKAKILKSGVEFGIENGTEYERLYSIVDDEKEVEILKKHYGFLEVPGKLLVYEYEK